MCKSNFLSAKLVLWDIDGTLCHTGGVGVKCFAEAAAYVTGFTGTIPKLSFAGQTDRAMAKSFLYAMLPPQKWAGLNIPTSSAKSPHLPLESLVDELLSEYAHRFLHSWPPQADNKDYASASGTDARGFYPGAQAAIMRLKSQGLRQGLLTGNIRATALHKLGPELSEILYQGGFADHCQNREDIARSALNCFAPIPPEEILIIGDTIHDVRAARHIGAEVLIVGHMFSREVFKEDPPDAWLDSLSDFQKVLR